MNNAKHTRYPITTEEIVNKIYVRWLSEDMNDAFGYKKAISNIDAMFAHSWTETEPCEHFEVVFGHIQSQSKWVFEVS